MREERRIILDVRWFSTIDFHIGVVAARTGMHGPDKGEWKAYVGVVLGFSPGDDAQYVANWGGGLEPQGAAGFFPWLDITKYKQE